MDTSTYIAAWHVKHNGKLVEPGHTLALTPAEAHHFGAAVMLAQEPEAEPAPAPAPVEPKPAKRGK